MHFKRGAMGKIRYGLCLLMFLLSHNYLLAQANTCETAEVLCSLSELDGFTGTMPEFNNTGELSSLCQPGGNLQNITWFGFIAGSTSATLELTFTNCDPGNGASPEIQYGVYTDCGFGESIICVSNAVPATIFEVVISPMVPGDDYFFFIDGDLGTFCDYSIDVISGGEPVPVPQPTAVNCISGNCPSDGNICSTGETFTFEPEGLDLSIDYIWTVTPSPPNGTTINGDNNFSATFNAAGTYEICVVGDNGCTMTDPVCYTLNVLEADAGLLSADPTELCPGATSVVTATGYIMDSPLMQGMIAVGPDGTVIGINNGDNINVTYDECGEVSVYSYNYNPADSPALPNLGDTYSVPNCGSSCCDTELLILNFNDTEQPILINTPVDITLECSDVVPDMPMVDWTDNCDGTGQVAGMQTDDFNTCTGGTITRTWTYTDGCDNTTDYEQVITINSQDGGSFDSTPEDMTFDCAADIPDPIDLMWTGDCEGTATVSPTDSGNSDLCAGGVVTRVWSFTDACGGFTEETQMFTINAATPGSFTNAPANTTALCDQSDLPPMEDLEWVGDCDGTAMVAGVEDVDVESCSGGTITRTWSFTDGCGQLTEHVQTITVSPPPLADPINPPPPVLNVTCDEVPATFPTLTFTNNQTGGCLIMGDAEPEVMGDPAICGGTITVVWVYTDACFNASSYVQNINVLPAAEPAFIDPPADMTVSCVEVFPMPDPLDYSNGQTDACEISGTIDPLVTTEGDICGGDVVTIWEFTDDCGVTVSHTQTIIVEPIPEPMFVAVPSDVTVACSEDIPTGVDLSYTNNETGFCAIAGDVSPTESGSADICGGTILYEWEFLDDCGRTITASQMVTVEPAPEPTFTSPPSDITIGCDEIPPTPPSLSYTNGESASCVISGDQTAAVDDQSNSCGGTITYTWEFTDECSRLISHSQIVTISEAPIASYIGAPADITVECNAIPAPAGDLNYSNSDPCEIMGSQSPVIAENYDICGGSITNTWSFTDDCGRLLEHVQIITVEPAPVATFQDVPANTTVACGDDATNPGNLMYTNNETTGCLISGEVAPTQSGSITACGGDILFTWDFTDDCGRPIQAVQTVFVDPAPTAVFLDDPADITVSCADFMTTPPTLAYSNSESGICLISGSVSGTVEGGPNSCGTTVMYRWEFVDDCGRSIVETQNVTIEEAPEASFTSTPPPAITLNCDEVSTSIPTLNYTNGASGICAISGVASGIQSGSYDQCGGNITYTWTFTDDCNRTITFSQDLTINPASEPMFTSLPADITLDCGEDFPDGPTLDYTNGESGACAITGSVNATSTLNGNITTYEWSFINTCSGEEINHTQNITGVPTPDISIDPTEATLCLASSFDLSTIVVNDANGNSITVTYEDAGGIPITDPIVSPTNTTSYTIIAANVAGCTDEAMFTLNIEEPPFAGNGGAGLVCSDGGLTFNLFDNLIGNFTPGGTWFDTDGSGANIDDPINASFSGVTSGMYTFTYTVFSTNSCPDAETTIELEVVGELNFEILSVQCDPGGATYSVNVLSNGNNIFSSEGDVNTIDENNVIVENIPSGTLVVISAIDPSASCITDKFINAPDCDCPDVPSPISGGDQEICEGETIPELSVTVEAGLMANWYESQTSMDALIENSLTYTPTVSDAGIYMYYVESEDSDGCVSLIRTLITLTINAVPEAMDIDVPFCANSDGEVNVTLQDLNGQINSNASFDYTYFANEANANSGSNPLSDPFVTNISTTLFVVVENSSGCQSIAEVNIEVNDLPNYTSMINNESCIDETDGSIILSDINPSSTEFSLDNIDFISTDRFEDLEDGSYTLYAQTDAGCESELDFTIEEGIELSFSNLELNCNDGGTSADSGDDFYTISFNLENNFGGTGNVNIQSTSEDFGDFPFGDVSIVIDAGSVESLILTDVDSGCSIEIALGELTPCSTSCSVTIDQLDIFCDGNGTDSDPNDDVYSITINASAVNGASNNTFNVTVDAIIVANFEYGVGGVITIPAQGQTVVIAVVDNEDNQCFSSQSIGPLDACSDECIVTVDNQNFICDNNGTIGVPSDDFYTFSFTVLATNSTSTTFTLFIDGVDQGMFDYNEEGSIVIPADGLVHEIQIIDNNNSDCSTIFDSPELMVCSGACSINASIQSTTCDNASTALNELDDTYFVELFINVIGGSGEWSIPETGQNGNSGETVIVGPFLITDGNRMLEIQDASIGSCSTMIELTPPSPCSSCEETVEAGDDWDLDCTVSEAILMGMPSVELDGIWTGPGGFVFNGNETAVSVAGKYFFTVDYGDGCIVSDSLVVSTSSISIDEQAFMCNSNGTESDPSDDFYTFTFNVSYPGSTSLTFSLFIDNVEVGDYTYGEEHTYSIDADNASHPIGFVDGDTPACMVQIESPELETCSGLCIIEATVAMPICDNQGTADDDLDDTYTAEVTVSHAGGSGIWVIPSTGQTGSNGETITVGPFLISNGNAFIDIQDQDDENCSYSFMIITPPTCSSCDESVEAGNDAELDCVVQDATLIGIPSVSSAVGTWTGPGGFTFIGNQVTVDIPGKYFYTVDFGDNCIRTDSLEITVSNEIPVANAGENQEITCIMDMVTLTGSVVGGSGNFTFRWLDAGMTEISTDLSITVSVAGNYFFEVYDVDSDCTSPLSLVEVIENTDDLDPSISADPNDALDCVVTEITLSTIMVPNVEYTWIVNSVVITGNQTSITVTDEATIELEAINIVTGCTGNNTLIIENFEEYPIVSATPLDVIDCINEGIIIDGSNSQEGPSITYTWLDESGNILSTGSDMIEVTEEGTYYLQLVDIDNSCTNTDTIIVESNIELPEIQLDDMATINCDETELSIALVTTDDPASLDISWQTSDGTIISSTDPTDIVVGSAGTYFATVLNPVNQCENKDTIIVVLPEQIEDASITIEDESCEVSNNGTITINTVVGGTSPFMYYIDGELLDENAIENLSSGSYNVVVIDDNGCDFETTIVVDIQEPFEVNVLPEITANVGTNLELQASTNLTDQEIGSIIWTPSDGLSCNDCLNPTLTVSSEDLTYTVGITDINGCYAEAEILVRSDEDVIVTVPNVFKSGNQGGVNSNFTIYSSVDATINKLRIFDRWGNLMFANDNFATNNPLLGWDGKYNSQEVVDGVYVYVAEIVIDGEIINKSGDITVVK